MTISRKMTVAALLMLVLTAGMSGAMWWIVERLGGDLDRSVNVTARKADLVASVQDGVHRMAAEATATQNVYVIDYLESAAKAEEARSINGVPCSACHGTDTIAVRKERFEANAKQMQNVVAELGRMADAGEESKTIETIGVGIGKWVQLYGKYLQLAEKREFPSAHLVLTEQMFGLQDELGKATASLTAGRQAAAKLAGSAAVKTITSSEWGAVGMAVVSLILSVGLLFLIRRMCAMLRRTMSGLREQAEQVAGAVGQMAASSQHLAQGASEQAASLEETAATSEMMRDGARRNAQTAGEAAEVTAEVAVRITTADEALRDAVAAMREIQESSNRISRIIQTIDEIAFQTNILALNAAVEAARAGDAGAGFAVVADEVRSLAQRSAQAAKDTAALIEESIAKSGRGNQQIAQAAAAMHEITESAGRMQTLAAEIRDASQQQGDSIEQIARTNLEMQQVTQSVAASAEEGAASGQQLDAHSAALRKVVEKLTALVGSDCSAECK